MTGRAAWLPRYILLVMFLLHKKWSIPEIITKFKQMFPEVAQNQSRGNNSTQEPIGHTEASIKYCKNTLLVKGA